MKRKKPKFRVGQVVAYKAPLGTRWVQIRTNPDSHGNFYINGHPGGWANLCEVRPLTRRERGDHHG